MDIFKHRSHLIDKRLSTLYRTKELILDIYDKMAESIAADANYQALLNSHPSPPTDANSSFIRMQKWEKLTGHLISIRERSRTNELRKYKI